MKNIIENKKAMLKLTTGMIVRLVASVIMVTSLPFLILNPQNVFAIVSYGFGNFLLLLGGVLP